jgi:hypothetical protein
VPEAPIGASIVDGDCLVLTQEGRCICVNWESVKQLKKLLDMMAAIHRDETPGEH